MIIIIIVTHKLDTGIIDRWWWFGLVIVSGWWLVDKVSSMMVMMMVIGEEVKVESIARECQRGVIPTKLVNAFCLSTNNN